MIAVIKFRDEEVEVIEQARILEDKQDEVEVKTIDGQAVRYEKKEVRGVEIVWR